MRRHRIRGLTSPCTLLRCVVDTSGEDSEISHEERVELYAIEEVAPHAGVRLLAEKNARNLPRFLAHRGVTPFNREAFDRALAAYHAHCDRAGAAYGQLPLWLDSCCGTGRSTLRLAEQNPGAFVIGVDKSGVRLERNAAFRRSGDGAGAPNAVLVRADCCDFWRLLWESGARVQRHTLFYPNPYPKPRDLPRRWHGDPAFPILLRLGGDLEARAPPAANESETGPPQASSVRSGLARAAR